MIKNLALFWSQIDHVFLDMDGTLLDKHFDDYFWENFVPETYAEKHNISFADARIRLLEKYKTKEGTLEWTDLDFWSDKLGLDIPAMKVKVDHLIAVHPYVIDFLEYCRQSLSKKVVLVTNAHSKTLEIKMNKTALRDHFDQIICSQQIGVAKEDPQFWEILKKEVIYDPARTMLADDTLEVLISAEQAGIKNLIYVAKPSSKTPVKISERFTSITFFKELIEGL